MWKAPLPHNKRICYPPYPDHYLIELHNSFSCVVPFLFFFPFFLFLFFWWALNSHSFSITKWVYKFKKFSLFFPSFCRFIRKNLVGCFQYLLVTYHNLSRFSSSQNDMKSVILPQRMYRHIGWYFWRTSIKRVPFRLFRFYFLFFVKHSPSKISDHKSSQTD